MCEVVRLFDNWRFKVDNYKVDYLDTLEGMLVSYKINSVSVPYTDGKYRINRYGELIDENDNIVPVVEQHNEYYVLIEWLDEISFWKLATVVIISCRPNINLPKIYFRDIIPLYRDNNPKNTSPSNLTYKLPEISILNNNQTHNTKFYYVPEYTNYGISRDGKVLRIAKDTIYVPPIRERGNSIRSTIKIIDDHNKISTIYIYRLVAMTFIDHDSNYEDLAINHKDGNCQNNNETNLEWVTKAENNVHAFNTDLMGTNKRVETRGFISKKINSFRSITQCAKYYNVSSDYIVKSIEIGFMKISNNLKDFYEIKYENDEYKFLIDVDIDNIPVKKPSTITNMVSIKALNVFTNEEIIYKSTNEAAKNLGITDRTIRVHIERNSLVPTAGYIFRNLNDDAAYPEFSQDQLIIFKENLKLNNGTRIVSNRGFSMLDLETKEKRIWVVPENLYNFLGISNTTFFSKFGPDNESGEHIFKDRYKVSVIRLEGTMPI